MKIGIDVSSLIYQTGVSWYTRNLVNALQKIDKRDEFVLFGGSLRRMGELRLFANRVFPIPPTAADIIWNRLHVFPIEWLIGKVDVFHSSDWAQPPTAAYKVTTIHDLVPIRFPQISHPQVVAAHRARLAWVKKEVDRIISVSEFTKREMVELLGIDPARIVVIPEAPDPVFKPRSGRIIEGDYLLVVGADPRKNIPAIIQAYRLIIKHYPLPLSLVIVGRPWEKIPKAPGVRVLGHVSREQLAPLYSGAKALVYTSLYEGFGLPILEAMACHCPVVASNTSSIPEVAGDAAVLVDPTNPQDIAEGVEKALAERQKWIRLGKKRVKQFSWEKTARTTLKVYRGEI